MGSRLGQNGEVDVGPFLDGLRRIVGDSHVLIGDVTAGYVVDWTGRFRGATPAVVRPGSTAEVAAVVVACADAGMAIVPQGGNTGLVGGSVPLDREVVLSLRRLVAVDPVDPGINQVTAQAGVTIAAVQGEAARAGWAYGVDWAARDTATVGGSIATNAGGMRVLRHGDTRRQLLGVEAVLGDGSVIAHLGGLEKDNTGYDLAGLLCGSEGTLGIVTAARLRLVPRHDERVVALLAFDDAVAAMVATVSLRRRLASVDAIELFLHGGLELVRTQFGLARPFPTAHACYLLVEAADTDDPTDALAAAVEALDDVADVAVAVGSDRREELWRYREGHTEALNRIGPPHKLDVTLPVPGLAVFLTEVSDVVATAAPRAQTWLFGHAGDGNVHVNVTGIDPGDDRVGRAVDSAVLELVAARGGSISAEHGIGTAKRPWLHLNRSAAELHAMAAIKAALDPERILNPRCLLP